LGFALFAYRPSAVTFVLSSIIIGLTQHGFAILGHEAVHYRISSNRFINDSIGGLLCFFPVGMTVSTYREFHLPHHRAPLTESDPETPIRNALGKNWQPPFNLKRGFVLWGLSFFGLSLREFSLFLKMFPVGSLKERGALLGYWGAIGIFCYRNHTMAYLGIWYLGLLTTYFSTLRIQGWYEHGLENSIVTNRYALPSQLFRILIPHNVWVHYEHHKYPSVPFYNLEKARALDQSEKIYTLKAMIVEMEKLGAPEKPSNSEHKIAS
jgi:fatty acid desaturase